MDVAIRDQLLNNLQLELENKKLLLHNKSKHVQKLSGENKFLNGVNHDYKTHYRYIKKIKEEQYRSMAVLSDYLDNLKNQTGTAEESIKKANTQQKKLFREMNKLKNDIDNLVVEEE